MRVCPQDGDCGMFHEEWRDSLFTSRRITGAVRPLVLVLECDAPRLLFRAEESKETAHLQHEKARLVAACST